MLHQSSRFLLFALILSATPLQAGPFQVAGNEHDGEALTCDLPISEHLRNTTGRDGLGLCVFTSIDHAACWANEPALIGFRDYMTKQAGGGWPEKVDEFIPRMAASKGLEVPSYVQHTGGDAAFLKLALKTGRYVCVTYNGRDGAFYNGPIAHMVNLVHLSDRWAVIHDNNFPGKWLWMPPAEFLNRWRGSGGGWAIVLLKPGPPPIPINVKQQTIIENSLPTDCPSSICSPGALRHGPSTDLTWHPDARHPGFFYLFRGNQQLGTWYPDSRGYRELRSDGTWSVPGDPPIPLPAGTIMNFGLDAGRVSVESRYSLNGKPVSRGEAFAAFGNLSDDSGKLRLTIVGDEVLRQRVLTDLANHRGLKEWRDRLLVQDYAPDNWAVANVGFAPGITLQPPADASGKAPVLFRLANYEGPDVLTGAIRKADPTYQPDKDPVPSNQPTNTTEVWYQSPDLWLLVGLLLVFILVCRKEKR